MFMRAVTLPSDWGGVVVYLDRGGVLVVVNLIGVGVVG